MRFCMALSLTEDEAYLTRDVDANCSKHLAVINDIWSFEKEVVAAEVGHEEGGVLCSSVSIFAGEAAIFVASAKRTLCFLCREWQLQHEKLTAMVLRKCDSPQLRAYFKGLECQISANEKWSRSTPRYHQ
jgi:aristolochene synthase